MNQLSPTKLLKIVYPYRVISRVALLVLGSLIFLILHESIRHFRARKLSSKRELDYVNRTN
jgi:hypothetical protein